MSSVALFHTRYWNILSSSDISRLELDESISPNLNIIPGKVLFSVISYKQNNPSTFDACSLSTAYVIPWAPFNYPFASSINLTTFVCFPSTSFFFSFNLFSDISFAPFSKLYWVLFTCSALLLRLIFAYGLIYLQPCFWVFTSHAFTSQLMVSIRLHF